jgi:hypothetical protein
MQFFLVKAYILENSEFYRRKLHIDSNCGKRLNRSLPIAAIDGQDHL